MNTSPEERKEIASLIVKSILNKFPIVGPILTDIFFTYRSNVKQARLNHFVRLLEDEMIKLNIDPKTLKTEENLDLFESIFQKVLMTRSAAKRAGFKNILIHGLKDASSIDYCEIFGELLLELKDQEIEILQAHRHYLVNGKGVLLVKNDLENELHDWKKFGRPSTSSLNNSQTLLHRTDDEIKKELINAQSLLDKYKSNCIARKFKIEESEYRYFIQNLFSKGLLFDDGVGAIGTGALEIMSITNFGLRFLIFIKSSEG